MCEFCHQHGEGKKWYLQAKNYSDDLLSDLRQRRFFDFKAFSRDVEKLEDLKKAPFIVRAIQYPRIMARVKKMHYGQVLPIEDVEQIFGFVNSVVRIACICRKAKWGKEQRYCYGISVLPKWEDMQKLLNPNSSFAAGPETTGLEKITKEEALGCFKDYEKE
ncbi:MAG: 4Fe-4S ferredoxin, partial [Chloroflexota bacterium]